jgi:hypothetical protein
MRASRAKIDPSEGITLSPIRKSRLESENNEPAPGTASSFGTQASSMASVAGKTVILTPRR